MKGKMKLNLIGSIFLVILMLMFGIAVNASFYQILFSEVVVISVMIYNYIKYKELI